MDIIIYKIKCKDTSVKECYIGSTKQPFYKRKGMHKYDYNKKSHRKIYKFMHENGGWDKFEFEIIHKCNVKDRKEQCQIERIYMEMETNLLNTVKPYESKEEKLQRNREYRRKNKKILEKAKEYHQKNKERISQRKREYNKVRVECPHCNKSMNKSSLKRHIKSQHPTTKT